MILSSCLFEADGTLRDVALIKWLISESRGVLRDVLLSIWVAHLRIRTASFAVAPKIV